MKRIICLVFTLVAFILQAQAAPVADDGKTFLENFYQEGANHYFDRDFVKKHLTKKALKFLHHNYDYDDESGDGLATWLFYQEGGWDVGEFDEVLVEKVGANTYKVLCRSKFNEDVYEYPVQFTLAKMGKDWKIDSMNPGKGLLIPGNPGITSDSKWGGEGICFTAKVNDNKTISFTAMGEGDELAFLLTPDGNVKNEFVLGEEPEADGFNPFSKTTRARLIDENGLKLLCLYDQKGLLQHVLDGKSSTSAAKDALSKWGAQLQGKYTAANGEPVVFEWNSVTVAGKKALYEHKLFNDCVIRVINITGNNRLAGTWEAALSLDGLTLYEVEEDEYGMFDRKGRKEVLKWARNDFPRFNFASAFLLNDGQFRRLKKSTLRIMRNSILASNGFRFQSKDLQDYFSQWSWYHPAASNDDVKPNLIQRLNIELIQAEEACPDEDRFVVEE
ncbi:MAG: YARHG domain-containing protein [Muribaculaceae bacterium]|nr:YARHG domain-containing protein [Muribaculaceae bacterium]